MKVLDKIHGFKFTREVAVSDIGATLYEGVYEKNGAKLLYIDRKDNNKTFSIAFKTIPEDSTGVFHILEHSVLCGSDKYPVKEPFVELLKGSLKTFLNAMTYPDKTVYPVSSRNEKDFLNLVDVYMDAVLHPLAVSKPEIFYQEGWHHEIHSKEEEMIYKGVVFNEMKGAYSSVDEIEMSETAALLYEGTTYGLDSGGDPTVIPDLSYEEFCAAHARYYHPSNARIILDGSVDLDKTLALLDSYLKDYDYLDINTDIPGVVPKGKREKTVEYEISEGEDPVGKCRLCLGFMSADHSDRRTLAALSIAIDAIAGSNEAPFKKAILDTGIAEDVTFISYDGISENSLMLEVKNIKEEDRASAEELVFKTISELCESGIDKKTLTASINRIEFNLREQDMVTFPAGLAFSLSALDTWLYGSAPELALKFEDDFAFLREAINTDYFEKLLRKIFLESNHSAALFLKPSAALGEERARVEKERLAAAKASMSTEETDRAIALTLRLEEWQKSQDTPEALATLPKLELSDIDPEPERYPIEEYELSGIKSVFTEADSRGIIYTNLLFDISDFTEREIFLASLANELFKNLDTENYGAIDLQNAIKTDLGSLSSAIVVGKKGETVTPYLKIGGSALVSKTDALRELMREVFLKTEFTDRDAIGRIIKQLRSGIAESISASGHAVAIARSAALTDREAAVCEYIDGVENYLMVKELDKNFDSEFSRLSNELAAICKRIFTKTRLTIFHTGEKNDKFMNELIELFPTGEDFPRGSRVEPLGKVREGILIPSGVSYAGLTANVGSEHQGALAVVRSVLSYGYLWNEIRVQGGAYGAGFVRRKSGITGFYTYRDPDAARSVGCFAGSGRFLREFAKTDGDVSTFIIGAIGDSEPLVTPKVLSGLAIAAVIRGESFEDRRRVRREMLSVGREELLACADIVDRIIEIGAPVVVGGKEKLDAFGDGLDRVIEI